jgi:signal transduction histidine kinase
MLVVGVILHYPQEILGTQSPSLFSGLGLTRHALERVYLLLPVAYAGLVFQMRGGLICLVAILAIMLPRAILISQFPADSLFEAGVVIVIGGLVNLWFEQYRREQGRRQQALLRLEATRQQLESYVRVIERSEKRLSAINAVSTVISQSLELQDVLEIAAAKVTEVMGLDVALVFLLNEDTQELELKAYRGVSQEFVTGMQGLKVGEGFNGMVARTGEPLLVDDASQDPRLTRDVVVREGIQAQLIVPLEAKGKVVGTLTVAGRGSRHFRDEEVELLTTIGSQVGIAIENSRLYQQERLMVEQEKEMQERLRFYLQQVTRAQEEERRRIAQELHDDTIQDLVILMHQLDDLQVSSTGLSRRGAELVEESRQQASRITNGVRRYSQDLRPSVLDDLGLLPALEWLANDVSSHFGINIDIKVIGSARRFTPETETVLFRIVQEALRNVWKHAKASRAWVTVEFTDHKAVFMVRDEGKGFEIPEKVEDLTLVGKLGLTGMQERAQLIGAKLTIRSKPGEGTTVTAEVPL